MHNDQQQQQGQPQQPAASIDKSKIFPLVVAAGIDKDGTQFSSTAWIDGEWIRFYRGLPKKIGGFRCVASSKWVITGCYVISIVGNTYVFLGGYNANYASLKAGDDQMIFVGYFILKDIENGVISVNDHLQYSPDINDITPISGTGSGGKKIHFSITTPIRWSFDSVVKPGELGDLYVFCHYTSNVNISESIVHNVFASVIDFSVDDATGIVSASPPATCIKITNVPSDPMPKVSGGMVVLAPFLFVFGSNGLVSWSLNNDLDTEQSSANLCATKIITARATRGGQNSPSGLFWSEDSLIKSSFIIDPASGTSTGKPTTVGTFKFDIISSDISIISPASVVESDGVFYWIGNSNFYCYTGVVQKIPNTTNMRYFFENLNTGPWTSTAVPPAPGVTDPTTSFSARVFGVKFAAFNEIWWFYPSKDSTDGSCDRAIIFNTVENVWYDTPIKRSCGYYNSVLGYPILVDSEQISQPTPSGHASDGYIYRILVHEYGINETSLAFPFLYNATTIPVVIPDVAIPFSIKSSYFSWMAQTINGQRSNLDRNTTIKRFEPDIKQSDVLIPILPIPDPAPNPIPMTYPATTVVFYSKKYAASPEVPLTPFQINYLTEKQDLRIEGRLLSVEFSSTDMSSDFELGQCLFVVDVGGVRP